MKKSLILLTTLFMLLTTVSCSNKTGAFEKVEDGTITVELQEMFDEAFNDFTGASYKPIKLLKTQVVAGTYYQFLAEQTIVYPGAEPKEVIVTIAKDLNGNVSILSIEDK